MANSDDAIRKDVNEATTAATATTGSAAVKPDPPVNDVDGGDIIEHCFYSLYLLYLSLPPQMILVLEARGDLRIYPDAIALNRYLSHTYLERNKRMICVAFTL